ncbi:MULTISPECIES: hypothetical protein [unclassified Lentimonas]|uniref:hypothetical protein n=1 Tax=unclassified Lentimonas TaxID=2630993 RepID=UPI001329175B|nr:MULTISPECIES: hypothetical protein [unclassified Lentimonas]CAA6678060.1 Unannotated [Lentimonas sp. CC4]CAA6687455.1 Unannotated [Lentimonas sp. CC6]CAA7076345.1 Unannotated [Lentimonas sp. CC4]CAA7171997.1 Unannotated [Lentimonas sp. CC21]CAA7180681.1 Unannotated [Lentimonas sp. CC8]
MKSKLTYTIVIALAGWLGGAFLFSSHAEKEARKDVTRFFNATSKEAFKDTDSFKELMLEWTSPWKERLVWSFPFGKNKKSSIEEMEVGLVYISANHTLSPEEWFPDSDLNQKYNIQPKTVSQEELIQVCINLIGQKYNDAYWVKVNENQSQ